MDGRGDGEGDDSHSLPGHDALPPGLWDCPACRLDCRTTNNLFSHVSWGPCSRQIGQTLQEFKADFKAKQQRHKYQKDIEHRENKKQIMRDSVSLGKDISCKYTWSIFLQPFAVHTGDRAEEGRAAGDCT
jgi:hypothetical protein